MGWEGTAEVALGLGGAWRVGSGTRIVAAAFCVGADGMLGGGDAVMRADPGIHVPLGMGKVGVNRGHADIWAGNAVGGPRRLVHHCGLRWIRGMGVLGIAVGVGSLGIGLTVWMRVVDRRLWWRNRAGAEAGRWEVSWSRHAFASALGTARGCLTGLGCGSCGDGVSSTSGLISVVRVLTLVTKLFLLRELAMSSSTRYRSISILSYILQRDSSNVP